jgi:asparagine synthase (glutamine-hydrolysing)
MHGSRKASSKEVAEGLYPLLKSEVAEYVASCEHVGILLSGGMDSRIVAGVLKEVQREQNDFRVTVFCWGQRDTRDPVYANRIADIFNWDFEHFNVTAATLRQNIDISAQEGCFYSAQHLHAMEDVANRSKELSVDCMLAGSYGDSIGRAEYSGVRVERLVPISDNLRNWFQLIDPDVYSECQKSSFIELERYHDLFKQLPNTIVNELDYQLHYMRNHLGSCMAIINERVPLRQVFTANSVVEYMWGVAPECRTNDVCLNLLGLINPELLKIPWARTGKPYLDEDVPADNIGKNFHRYMDWTHKDLEDYLKDIILSGKLKESGVFNMRQIEALLKIFYKSNRPIGGRIPEILLWLGSVSLFMDIYKSAAPSMCGEHSKNNFSLIGIMQLHAYALRYRILY